MKLDLYKIVFKETKENYKLIQHDNKFITFWTPKILMPFGIDHEYDKYILKLEFDDKNEEHIYFKKVILHIEKLMKKKIEFDDKNSREWKSIIKKRPNKSDIIELRIKNFKNNILTEVEFENKDSNENYLKTIFDLKKQTNMKVLIEINGLWDYRASQNKNQQYKIGLVCYASKLYI
jgi:hypothetical protein